MSTAVSPAISVKAANTPSRSPSWSLWPKRMENTVPLPMQRPRSMEVKKVMSVKDEPTAARALGPRQRPIISVSAIL